MRVGIIGAGPAGLTAAYELSKSGADVTVFESEYTVGGLARSITLWGQRVDLGPHRFFSDDARVNRLWLEVIDKKYHMVDRLTRIYYRGRFYDYPLKAGNSLKNMGVLSAAACTASYMKEKINFSSRTSGNGSENFESWVVSRFGRRLFEMFFETYSEKLWGISCEDLDADFAAQRIKKFSLGQAFKSALGIGNGKHKTLVDRFAYPDTGSGLLYERMAEQIQNRGGAIRLGEPIARVVHENRVVKGVQLQSGEFEPFDHVVSTMPLTLMVNGLGEAPPEVTTALQQLKYRNTVLVYLHVDGTDLFPDQWLYVHSPDLLTGRVANFSNWGLKRDKDCTSTVLALEYWCYDHDETWTEMDARLIEQASREMISTGLLGGHSIMAGHVFRAHRSYPVYACGYKDHLATIVEHLGRFRGITPIGRYGSFKYNNQDHSILMGLLAAENILHGKEHDLWSVNTDYDSYQEAARIDQNGLQKV